jgi:DNA-binding response OmpR family regulator
LDSILLVDDESETRNRIRRLLEKFGFEVAVAENAEAGVSNVPRSHPDLVVMNISGHRRGGLDLLEAVHHHDPDTPVIVMTADKNVPEAVRHAAFHYIRKPFSDDELVSLCKRAVENWHLKVENKQLKQLIENSGVAATLARSSASVRPERAALERATVTRMIQFAREAIARLSTPVLEHALAVPAAPQTITEVMRGVLLQDPVEGEWAAALLEGAQVQRDLLEQAGGALSADDVGSFLGIRRAAVDKRRRQGTLLGIKLPSNDVVYPAAQFGSGDVLPGLPDALSAFRIDDPWMQLDTLLAKHDLLGGRTGFDALKDGDVERVKQLVASVGEQGL